MIKALLIALAAFIAGEIFGVAIYARATKERPKSKYIK